MPEIRQFVRDFDCDDSTPHISTLKKYFQKIGAAQPLNMKEIVEIYQSNTENQFGPDEQQDAIHFWYYLICQMGHEILSKVSDFYLFIFAHHFDHILRCNVFSCTSATHKHQSFLQLLSL